MKTSTLKGLVILLIFLTVKSSFAQLSGTYTIGSGETYSTLKAAVDQLNIVGADGLVEFEIKAGTYSDFCTIDPLVGYSEGDSVAIKSVEGDVVRFNHSNTSANNYVIKLDGASHVSISGLSFIGSHTNYCNMINLTNGASYNTINRNYFEAPDGGTMNSAVVIFDDETGSNERHNVYSFNEIIGGSIGIKISGDGTTHQGPSKVEGNSISGSSYDYGLKMEFVNGGSVIANDVRSGIYLDVDSSFVVKNNYFETDKEYCLRIMGHDQSTAKGPMSVINNVLIGSWNTFALHIQHSTNLKMYHNTILNNSSGRQTMYMGNVDNVEFMNNIVTNEEFNDILSFSSLGANVTVDYNTYYSSNAKVGSIDGGASINLSDWKATAFAFDANSRYDRPFFKSTSTRDYRLKCTSGSAFHSSFIVAEALYDKNDLPRLTVPVWKGAYNALASDSITIDGFVADGLDTLRNGIVKIYGDMTSKVLLDSIGMSSIGANGYFKFDKVPYLREYWVKVIPDRVLAPDYVTCYQDTSLRWDETDPIIVTDSCDGQQILLVPRKLADKGTGPNSISGTITDISGSGKAFGTDPIPGLDVVLDRIPPSKTVAFTTTDENGYYEFGDLPDGNYVVSIDYEGLHSDTIYDINIAGGTEREYLDYCVDRNDRIQGCASGVNTEEVMITSTKIFPNPFQNEITIQTDLNSFDMMIYNMEGKIISSQNNLSSNYTVSTTNLSPGVYLLEVISNGISKKTSVVKY